MGRSPLSHFGTYRYVSAIFTTAVERSGHSGPPPAGDRGNEGERSDMYASMAPIATIGTAVLGARITDAVANDHGQLAHTGSGSGLTALVALASLAVGLVMLGIAAKRSVRTDPSGDRP